MMENSAPNILIVEDEAIIALHIKTVLIKAGYQVCGIAASGEAALSRVALDEPDLIVMDIHLADKIHGLEVAEKIFADRKVPIIFMTGYFEAAEKQRAEKLSPLGYLVKPVNMNELIRIITDAFPRSSAASFG